MLAIDPKMRPSALEVLNSEWISGRHNLPVAPLPKVSDSSRVGSSMRVLHKAITRTTPQPSLGSVAQSSIAQRRMNRVSSTNAPTIEAA